MTKTADEIFGSILDRIDELRPAVDEYHELREWQAKFGVINWDVLAAEANGGPPELRSRARSQRRKK